MEVDINSDYKRVFVNRLIVNFCLNNPEGLNLITEAFQKAGSTLDYNNKLKYRHWSYPKRWAISIKQKDNTTNIFEIEEGSHGKSITPDGKIFVTFEEYNQIAIDTINEMERKHQVLYGDDGKDYFEPDRSQEILAMKTQDYSGIILVLFLLFIGFLVKLISG